MNLKKISPDGVPHALERAERYRLLNELPVKAGEEQGDFVVRVPLLQ